MVKVSRFIGKYVNCEVFNVCQACFRPVSDLLRDTVENLKNSKRNKDYHRFKEEFLISTHAEDPGAGFR